ncbi:uridylate kinase [Micromonospora sp. NPDC023814]|uniref:uridylate kinase n=1 Tax=Micromonospora sp. NPDC023814 TaxID=3154596 RepID=UPI0033CFAC1E
MDQGTRDEMLGRLAEAVGSVTVTHPTRVAIDGPPAAGKTTLAEELAVVLRTQGRDVIRATIDDFLFPRARRYPRGEYSAEGCYFDTHDYDALLVFDGVFLMRPELIDRWDLRIFVSTALEKTVDRAVIRERRVSSRAEVERRWRKRYIPSQQFYFATVRPTDHVDIIVHNDEPQQPVWATQTH